MDRALTKSFIGWLEQATLEEIYARQEQAKALLERVSSDEVRDGVKFSLKLMDEELVARYCLQQKQA